MASKNQVTLTFAGDASKLESAFDEVGASAKNMGDEVKDSAKSFDTATDASDALDTKAMGFRDTVTGVQDSVKGFSQVLKGDLSGDALLTAGMGVGDLASGFTNLLGPALSSTVGWLAKTRAGMLAQAAASKVVAGATKVWTGIQAAFNVVMALNPIVLVIIAIVALVAIVVIAYKRSETFRKIVDGAFRAVGKVVSWLGDRFSDWWKGVKRIIGFLVDAFRSVAPRLRSAFSGLFNILTFPFRTAFNFISTAWNNTIGRLRWSVPGWVPFIGGNSISAPQLPRFHRGGIMPGAPGTEGLALLQAGERVTPAGQAGVMTVAVESGGGGTRADRAMATVVMELIRTGVLQLTVRNGRVGVAVV